jgi:hypothetical protein
MTELPLEQYNARPNIVKRFGLYFAHLNIYKDDEPLAIEEQFYSTRLYLSLLGVTILILLIFTGVTVPARTTTVTSPSLSLFEYLSDRYPSTLSCTCSQPVIPYSAFLSLAPRYHQVCSSVFISQSWISTLFSFRLNHYYPLDFRTAASSQFQILASLCRFAAQSITDSVKAFSMDQLVTVSALSRTVFDQQYVVLVKQLQTTTIADANMIDEYISFSIAQNFLSSSLRTTSYVETSTDASSGSAQYLWDESLLGNSISDFCFCYETYSCTPKVGLYNLSLPYDYDSIFWPKLPFYVPGMKGGCIPHESMLNSTLECFYNATCIEMLIQFMGGTMFPDPLDATVQSRFKPNMTISSMFADLLIEDWNYTSNFTGYFVTCAPASCSYTYTERFNAAYMFITFFGFIGGVIVALGFLTPLLVKHIIRRFKTKCCHRTEQTQQMPLADDEVVTRKG